MKEIMPEKIRERNKQAVLAAYEEAVRGKSEI